MKAWVYVVLSIDRLSAKVDLETQTLCLLALWTDYALIILGA